MSTSNRVPFFSLHVRVLEGFTVNRYESEESDNKVGEIETASTKSNRVHSHVERNALLFGDSVRNLSYSAKALASACAGATKQATKMRYAFNTSLQLVHATRKKVILESQNLVRMLSDSGGDSMQQLKHMNNMLQETQLQLLDEKAYSDKVLHEACNPELLGLTKQNALATEFMANARQAQIFLGRCRADIINGSSKNSVKKMATDQHYPMNLDGRVTEVKRLRAEVVRLRHTIHAYEKTEALVGVIGHSSG